jgi:hypothetical protein
MPSTLYLKSPNAANIGRAFESTSRTEKIKFEKFENFGLGKRNLFGKVIRVL